MDAKQEFERLKIDLELIRNLNREAMERTATLVEMGVIDSKWAKKQQKLFKKRADESDKALAKADLLMRRY